jgi:hypothetical protein
MIMSSLSSPWMLAIVGAVAIAGLMTSPNITLWVVCVVTLPIAVWLLGGKQAYPVLLWLIGITWLQITSDVVSADLTGIVLSETWLGPYRETAIWWSSCAALALAFGMRSGTRLGEWIFRSVAPSGNRSLAEGDGGVSLYRIVACYFVSLACIRVLGSFANFAPIISQPVLALTLVKFVFVYVLAAKVFRSNHGYNWLILVSLVELVIGLTGFFSSYKEAFIIIFIALAASRRSLNASRLTVAVTSAVVVVWASLVWTAVKQEYRYQVFTNSLEERLDWMGQRFFGDININYDKALIDLFARIGYTELYARVLERQDIGAIPNRLNFYVSAIQHILTPRILFPDKPILDDSLVTRALVGIRISEGTSIGVGLVAQAHVDFGFPGLLLPMLLIGVMTGLVAKYFMTRPAPLIIREGFTTATLFLAFPFAANIDKALGGFIIGCLVMGLVLKFGYPRITIWLAGSRAERNLSSDSHIRESRG